MNTIAILLTVHNRKEKSLACLAALYQCCLPKETCFEVFLTDDGSTDGTAEEIKNKFPDINVLQGNGNLFWNRGMINSWKKAAEKEFDYYCWLNDDTLLYHDAITELINCAQSENNQHIVCGSTCSASEKTKITYGGRIKRKGLLMPNGEKQMCDYFNGNIVLVPRAVFLALGTLDPQFHHALGDFDYGLRARKKGIKNIVAPHFLGECEINEQQIRWQNPNISITKRLKLLYSPLGNHPLEFFKYEYRHGGLIKACFHFFTNHIRVLFPNI